MNDHEHVPQSGPDPNILDWSCAVCGMPMDKTPQTLKELEQLCDKHGFSWEFDNDGQIVIYTGLKAGPRGLEVIE